MKNTIPVRSYEQIVQEASETATYHSRALAREGVCAPLRLYYRFMGLALQSEAISNDMTTQGWLPTDRLLSPSLPYDRYYSWVKANSSDLPIFQGDKGICKC